MTRAVLVLTAGQLATTTALVLIGWLAGRHRSQRLLDQVERDAWEDGWAACLGVLAAGPDPEDDLDVLIGELDAAVDQTHPTADPLWN